MNKDVKDKQERWDIFYNSHSKEVQKQLNVHTEILRLEQALNNVIELVQELFNDETEPWKIIQLGKILRYLKGEDK